MSCLPMQLCVSPGGLWGRRLEGWTKRVVGSLGAEAVPQKVPFSKIAYHAYKSGRDGSQTPQKVKIITGRGIYDISALCSENERSFVRQIKMLSFAYSGQQRFKSTYSAWVEEEVEADESSAVRRRMSLCRPSEMDSTRMSFLHVVTVARSFAVLAGTRVSTPQAVQAPSGLR
ncbi:hypothetical protein MUK42_16410 [Musa troglodytarum]|uniref:Uncharacterized protein n=1 Tax=Musa troglodytarum TaxID=320322 RepID=A0A9E7KQZ4_9LILI|nr:hypothetical protein MUK42_16410 [Musa troglodytarum]